MTTHAPLTTRRTSDPKGLRVAQVRRGDLDGRVVQAYLIETDDDMDAYQRLREEHARKALELTLRSPLPIEKFDHGIPSDTPLTGMMSLAWARSRMAPEGQMFGGNPFFQIEPAMLDGLTAMRRALLRGDVVLANRNGGWHTLTPRMEVLSSEEGSLV